MEQFKGHVTARLDAMSERLDRNSRDIDDLKDKQSDIVKLDTLMNIVIDTNKEQTKTLNGINQNLTKLNEGYDSLGKRMEAIEDNQKESSENSKIDLGKLLKDTIFKVVPAVAITYILVKFGLQ